MINHAGRHEGRNIPDKDPIFVMKIKFQVEKTKGKKFLILTDTFRVTNSRTMGPLNHGVFPKKSCDNGGRKIMILSPFSVGSAHMRPPLCKGPDCGLPNPFSHG